MYIVSPSESNGKQISLLFACRLANGIIAEDSSFLPQYLQANAVRVPQIITLSLIYMYFQISYFRTALRGAKIMTQTKMRVEAWLVSAWAAFARIL